jgi:ABC-type nitrate/sulfonate/bicarbonate transport system substrate-binding protein
MAGLIGRRAALGVLAAPAIFRVVNAQGLRKVKFTISWLPEGFYAYVFVTKLKNYWRDLGLDVDVARGYGSLPAAQAIAEGSYQFGTSNASAVVQLAGKGLALSSLAIIDYNPSMGLAVLDGSPIRHPKDLEGKRVAQTLASSDAAFFAPFCAKNDVDIKKVELSNMDPRVRNQALGDGRVDAITGFASSLLAALASTGKQVRFMLYGDYGVFLYGDIALLTQPKMVRDEPELCQAMTTGLLQGLKYSLTNPDESEALFLSAVPELKLTPSGQSFARYGMAVQRYNVLSVPDAKVHGLGWADLGRLGEMADLVQTYQGEPGAAKPDVSGIFSNRFAGGMTMTDAEWTQATQQTDFVAKLLRPSA